MRAGGRDAACSELPSFARGAVRAAMAPWLLPFSAMADEPIPAPSEPAGEPTGPVHQFTVNRGMLVVLVIETTSWYAGLLQAAVARIALEGQN